MLTLLEVKQLTAQPEKGIGVPSAKHLKNYGNVFLCKKLGEEAKLTVYREGYVIYEVGNKATVFPISACGDYEYGEPGRTFRIRRDFFDSLAWYIRLLLEGEVRKKTISYSAASEEWSVLKDLGEPVINGLIRKEMIMDFLDVLTARQRIVICQFYFHRKTQREISEEFHITPAAVRRIHVQAIRRMQKKRGIGGASRQSGKGVVSHEK